MAAKFKITRSAAKAIMVGAAKIKTADKWADEKLLGKMSKLPDIVDDDTVVEGHQKTLADLLMALSKGQEIEIVDDEEAKPAKGKKEKPAKGKAKKEEPAEEEDEDEEDDDDEEDEDEDEEEAPAPKGKKAKGKKAAAEEEEDDEEDEVEDEDEEDEDEDEEDEEDEEDKKGKKGKTKKEKPAKKEKSDKPKKSAVERDRFGSKLDSDCAKMNACFSKKGKTVDKIAEESGCTKSRVKGHCQYLAKKDFVENTEKGWRVKVAE